MICRGRPSSPLQDLLTKYLPLVPINYHNNQKIPLQIAKMLPTGWDNSPENYWLNELSFGYL